MTILSKKEGLLRISTYGIPHPNWIIIDKPSELPSSEWCEAPNGWSIRCAPNINYKFALPSFHYQSFNTIKSTLHSIVNSISMNTSYVIYPSWNFKYSGCLSVNSYRLLIEVVRGDIANLLRGKKKPGMILSYSAPRFNRLVEKIGEPIITNGDLSELLSIGRDIYEDDKERVLEWTKTTDNNLFIHDWIEIQSFY